MTAVATATAPGVCRLAGLLAGFLCLVNTASVAGPWVEVGRSDLRSDIQVLADAGIIRGPVTTWPLSWSDISSDLADFSGALSDYEAAALMRVRTAAGQQMRSDEVINHARLALSEKPVQIRSFEGTPREKGEAQVGASWIGERFTYRLQSTFVWDPQDGKDVRLDGSYVGMALGNWSLALSAQERWWGPGWQSSLIYSNNARPIPSITLDRSSTDPFKTKWLAWLGHWDLTVQLGQMENNRAIPETLFFGMRLTFKPLRNLEIGLSRTAQLCGEGRSCDFDIWTNMLIGNDNRGTNVAPEDEPGNQLAGYDVRWSNRVFGRPFALYGQMIGEDEGNRLPNTFIGQFGLETWGQLEALGTYRLFLEWSDTVCNFPLVFGDGGSGSEADCAYNHPIYESGYRRYGRSMGAAFDNDASVFTFGTLLTDNRNNTWRLRLGYGDLNRILEPDPANTVAQVETRYREIELGHRRVTRFGDFNIGLGYETRRNTVTQQSDSDARVFIEWVYDTW
ncbi:MAG: capsule assembly Wzi family protein [Gammaproteobacteria bacterium]|jgi:hypothetical protein|nr:capsule assembly Wzi family protein [Gammaproteobacteria bacterium]